MILIINLFFIYFFLAVPIIQKYELEPRLTLLEYCIFSICAIILFTAGNVHNDIRDQDIDLLNRGLTKQIVPQHISTFTASLFIIILLSVGTVLSFYLAYTQIGLWHWSIYFIAFGALWIYNIVLSKIALIGNVTIALLCALITPIAAYAVLPCLWDCSSDMFNDLMIIIYVSLFSFLFTVTRELLKDIEDKEGDTIGARRTAPILWGNRVSHIIITILLCSVLFLIGAYIYNTEAHTVSSIVCLILGCVAPILVLLFSLLFMPTPHYARLTQWNKLAMISGLFHIAFLSI